MKRLFFKSLDSLQEEFVIDENLQINLLHIAKKKTNIKKSFTFIHSKPNLKSNILLKILSFFGSSTDMQIKLRINKGSENTDSFLTIKTLIIDDSSYVRVVPSLEILESSVRAGHAATISTFDKSQILYLQTRGISQTKSKNILIKSFLRFK